LDVIQVTIELLLALVREALDRGGEPHTRCVTTVVVVQRDVDQLHVVLVRLLVESLASDDDQTAHQGACGDALRLLVLSLTGQRTELLTELTRRVARQTLARRGGIPHRLERQTG